MGVYRKLVMEKFSFIYTFLSSSTNFDLQERVSNLDSETFSARQDSAAESRAKAEENSNLDLSSALTTSEDNASVIVAQWYEVEPPNTYALDLSAIASQTAVADKSYPSKHCNYWGKILLAGSLSYLILVVGWLFGHHGKYLLTIVKGEQQIVLSKSDAEFLDYIERSLAVIDTQTSQNDLATKETERVVYVPVFTPQTNIQQPAVAQPSPSELEVVKIPSPPPLPAPTPVTEPLKTTKASDATTATAKVNKPAIEHTLIGVIELGNKSAALFRSKGVTEQIWQGEEINNSGWMLDSVANQKAQVSHQGEVRSLSIGEKF